MRHRKQNVFCQKLWLIIFLSGLPHACSREGAQDSHPQQTQDNAETAPSERPLSPFDDQDAVAPAPADASVNSPGPFPSAAATEPVPTGVDVGNPSETGPTGTGKLQFRVADAAIADSARSVIIRPIALELISDSGAIQLPLPNQQDIDLMQFQNGLSYLLVDQMVPTGRITAIHLILDPQNPATLILADNSVEPLFIPPVNVAGSWQTRLTGNLEVTIQENAVYDVTMHVDLRKSLLRVTDSLPANLLALAGSATYWLKTSHDTFLSHTVGALRGVGLVAILARIVCVFPGEGGLIGIDNGTSECLNASGSARIVNNGFYVGYLRPGSYSLRLYLTDSLFVNVPGLFSVTAGVVNVIDLSLGLLGQ